MIDKICRRIEEIEYTLACKDQDVWTEEDLLHEKEELEEELEKWQKQAN